MVEKIILVFKTHFDIGFTDLSSRVINKYANSMLNDVITTCRSTRHMGKLKYVWTMPSWPLKTIIERCNPEQRKELDELIEEGQIVWHALPYTSHTDFCTAGDYIEGLRYAVMLSEKYNKPYPVSAKMTDVPGHGIMLPEILGKAGIKFLHLGCNAFANPPKVPDLFKWQAPSGESVLAMYSKGGYGTSLFPPDDWEFPVWMALMHTSDNCGPHSADIIENLVRTIHSKYPNVEVVCGTMDDFYHELSKCDLSNVPVITKDLSDTWIHGVGTYPAEISIIREERERSKRLQALFARKVLEGSEKEEEKINNVLNKYFDNTNLFGEHTWGADVKTWLGSNRVYRKEEFLKAKSESNYKLIEQSWQEQRELAIQASLAMNDMKSLIESCDSKDIQIFNPNGSDFTGWVILKDISQDLTDCGLEMDGKMLPITKINEEWACFVEKIPPYKSVPVKIVKGGASNPDLLIREEKELTYIENHRYRLTFSGKTGEIIELFDKKLNSVLLKKRNQSLFMYQYDRYGIEDITNYLKDYAYRFYTWGIQDYGKEGYTECEHKTYTPRFISYSLDGSTLRLHYAGDAESVNKYGDANEIEVAVNLPPAGDEIFVSLKLTGKQETPYVESGSFLVPLAFDKPQYRINKPNALLDPATDIQECANHVFYCLENHIHAVGEKSGVCVVSQDVPLVALGETGIYSYRIHYEEPNEPTLYFNLFNNMWGTNFPQWIGGNLQYRFILFGFEADKAANVMERAAELRMGVETTYNKLEKDFGIFPEHMQLINVRKAKDGIILRFRDLSGENATRRLKVNGCYITPINLRNIAVDKSCFEECEFNVQPYGIYSFLASKDSLQKE